MKFKDTFSETERRVHSFPNLEKKKTKQNQTAEQMKPYNINVN